ncbi:hypothetical protein MRB53_037960 [Persea americana]|nr:hypothetical protein MRB53_037960 [Persea americana]
MRERLTYFHPLGTAINPASIKFPSGQLDYADYRNATIEKRITFGLDELNDKEQKTSVCALLKNLFSIDGRCVGPKKSFSSPSVMSERFASTATYQYYRSHHDIASHPNWSSLLCPPDVSKLEFQHRCLQQAKMLRDAAEVYLDFDAISQQCSCPYSRLATKSENACWIATRSIIIFEGLWRRPNRNGFLSPEKADEPEEIKLGGFLRYTLFIPFKTSLNSHKATQQLRDVAAATDWSSSRSDSLISAASTVSPDNTCALHAYFTIPAAIFLDRYQLMEQSLLKSKNLVALRTLSGAEDLEAPDWTIEQWGSAALFELSHPANISFKQSASGMCIYRCISGIYNNHLQHLTHAAIYQYLGQQFFGLVKLKKD